jgi:ferredoxin
MRKNLRSWSYLANGKTLSLDETRCVGCGLCLAVCPHGVFRLEARPRLERGPRTDSDSSPGPDSGRGLRAAIVARQACMECGACAKNCPTEALSVRPGVGCAIAVLSSRKKGGSLDCGCGCGEESDCC